MSDLSSLAKAFEQNSKQQANDISESVKSAFEQHEKVLLKALNESASTTATAIRDQHRNLSMLVLKGWMWLGLSLLLVFSASAGALFWTGQKVADNLAQIEQQRQTLAQIEARTWGLRLQEGTNGRFIVLPDGVKAVSGWTVGKNQALKLE